MATRSETRPAPKVVRFRVNVPADDQEALAFVASQVNLSASIRQLMHDYVETQGLTDAMSAPVAADQAQAVVAAAPKSQRRARGKAAKALSESVAAGAKGKAGVASRRKPAEAPVMTPAPSYPDPNEAIRQMMGG